MAKQLSLKQLAIDKDNTTIVIAVGLASILIIFSIVASNSLIKQQSYQAEVIDKKKKARDQLEKNVEEVNKLKTAYQTFADSQTNVLGGNAKGTGDKDGENPRIVLDALPSKYDFPALTTSLNKMLKDYNVEAITGTDDELAQGGAAASGAPQPVDIPYTVLVNGTAGSIKPILQTFERSIRPMQVKKLTITGDPGSLKITVDAKTYFQPPMKFDIKTETVKKK